MRSLLSQPFTKGINHVSIKCFESLPWWKLFTFYIFQFTASTIVLCTLSTFFIWCPNSFLHHQFVSVRLLQSVRLLHRTIPYLYCPTVFDDHHSFAQKCSKTDYCFWWCCNWEADSVGYKYVLLFCVIICQREYLWFLLGIWKSTPTAEKRWFFIGTA